MSWGQSTVTVWKPGEEPSRPARENGRPSRRRLLRRDRRPSTRLGRKNWRLPYLPRGLEEGELAAGSEQETPFAFCRFASASGASRLLAGGTTSGRMAADRMADGETEPDQILAVHTSDRYFAERTGGDRQTSLDHRAGLPRTEAGTRTRPLRRAGLARIPSSRHTMSWPLMDSWWPSGTVFPPPPAPPNWTYRAPTFRLTSGPAAPAYRAERHNPRSIASLAYDRPLSHPASHPLPFLLTLRL